MDILFLLSIYLGGYLGSYGNDDCQKEKEAGVLVGAVTGGVAFMALYFGLK